MSSESLSPRKLNSSVSKIIEEENRVNFNIHNQSDNEIDLNEEAKLTNNQSIKILLKTTEAHNEEW